RHGRHLIMPRLDAFSVSSWVSLMRLTPEIARTSFGRTRPVAGAFSCIQRLSGVQVNAGSYSPLSVSLWRRVTETPRKRNIGALDLVQPTCSISSGDRQGLL